MDSNEIGMLDISGIKMPYARIGQESKPFVILPGLSLSLMTPLARVVGMHYQAFLDAGYTLYVFDRRVNAPADYTQQDMADDTAACMEHLGIQGAAVMGASQGGMIAQLLAADYPRLVDRVMLCSTCAVCEGPTTASVRQWIELARARQGKALADSFGGLIYSPKVWAANQKAVEALCEGAADQDFERFVIMASALLGFDATAKLEQVSVPAFVVGAQGDRVIPIAAMRDLAARLGCQSYFYDASFGHAVYDEAPDFVGKLLSFCRQP